MPKKKKQKTKHSTAGELSQAEIWDDSALIRSWNDAVAEYEYYHSIHARGEDVEEILRKAEMGEFDDQDEHGDTAVDSGRQVSGEWRPVHPEAPAKAVAAAENENTDAVPDVRAESDGANGVVGVSSYHSDGAQAGDQHSLEEKRKEAMDQFKSIVGEPEGQQENPRQPSTTTTTTPALGPNLPPATEIANGQVPATTTNPSQEQTLENIKMAYYWAGYYSGLYDGQRQAQALAETQRGGQTQ
ncbi:uncharacterized protein Z519_08168 [Cladophialophora bantiana CBS 173.52]|uniref:Survival Motor Neuron Gemin2-binding domain-containing protein n=1 Tax=Cladophialophora bantiana (strain ATCC 10958 / CBS 173.52 / CDC B-1940 / NIH 8579) TaxID=1442370 RepID=A0A0D2FXR2_CLAB1|nr:uncharacterized protein Z519_08168 [Cladophialophora bantiana CBS 173.52]KIW91272.1 hypothetical protein Z519_08168 [Cladophialophora bantiana CBS 173.52]